MSENAQQNLSAYPYSYHTFIYPFIIKKGNFESLKARFDAEAELTEGKWEYDDLIAKDGKQLRTVVDKEREHARLDYQTFQYFNPATRKALLGAERNIIANYRRKNAKGGAFNIKRGTFSASLVIEAIRLKLFNTNIGVIVFETEYHPQEGTLKDHRAVVKQINEWGRRLYPEYLLSSKTKSKEDYHRLLCADELEIRLWNEPSSLEVFIPDNSAENNRCPRYPLPKDESFYDGSTDPKENKYLKDPIHLTNVITKTLGLGEKVIEPAIDDRMFVCCCIMDQEYVNDLVGYQTYPDSFEKWTPEGRRKYNNEHRLNSKWLFMNDWEAAADLYSLISIDDSTGNCSCQNHEMMLRYFEEQLYPRWIEYGTIHAVTNHSMIGVTGNPEYVMDTVVNPFLVIYVQICILVLAQRASLLYFDEQITNTISKEKTAKYDAKNAEQVIELAKAYARFQGQLLVPEVTPQIQGIEIYKKLQNMLFIPDIEQNVQKQLDNLYQIAEAERDSQIEEKDRRMQGAFTVIAILSIVSACNDLLDFFGKNPSAKSFMDIHPLRVWAFSVLLVGLVVAAIFEYWYRGNFIRDFIKNIRDMFRKKGENE